MIADAEFVTGDPGWLNFLPGISLLGFIFTGVEASGHLAGTFLVKYAQGLH